MARIENIAFIDNTTGSIDIDEARSWESPSESGRLYRTSDDRWFLDYCGVPCHEIRPNSAATLLLQWGWKLPPTLARAVEEREEAEIGPRPRLPLSSLTPVILNGPDASPLVLGVLVPLLTRAQYDVVSVLTEAGPHGLSLTEMEGQCQHGDPRKTLRRVLRSASEWRSVIRLAGKPGGRYRIALPV